MAKLKPDEIKLAAYWIAVSQQQNFYEITSDWNIYKSNEHFYLQNYIGYALYGPPKYEVEDDLNYDCDALYFYSDKEAMKTINKIYDKIVQFGTQLTEDKEVLCSVLYISIYDENVLSSCEIDKFREYIYIKPVFKIRKNIKKENIIEYHNYYIDTEARVYKSWQDYLSNNHLPSCTMIAPKDGIYQADLKETWSDTMSSVWVEVRSNNTSTRIINTVDTASTFANLGGAGIVIAALFTPVAPPVLIAASAVGTLTGLWGGGRGIAELVDRSTHEQSININNREVIPTWLGVAGNAFGLAANCGSALLSRAIRNGTSIGKGAQIVHDAILIGNLVVNSSGMLWNSWGIVQKYQETGQVSSKDVFFLTAHLLFVCNSAVNIKLASEIIKSDQNQILKDYEDSLRSNRHRKEFRRLVKNTGSNIVDEVHRNEQLIRTLTKINNKDEFFASLVRNRKVFASAGTKVSFADGQVQINDVTLINPSTFSMMSKASILSLINQDFANKASVSVQNSTSNGNVFISDNLLKTGASAIRDFCVKKSVSLSMPIEQSTIRYSNIINDLRNINDKYKIMELLLETGLTIANRTTVANYSFEDLLEHATQFIWSIVKINLSNSIPNFNMFEQQYRNVVMKIVKETIKVIDDNWEEWTRTFVEFMNSLKRTVTFTMIENVDEPCLSTISNEFTERRDNHIILINPDELMTLSNEISTIIIQEALGETGSKLNKSVDLSKDLKTMCKTELNDFFSKHSISLKFNLSDLLVELKGILFDLKEFEMKNIIFYKLIVISVNIAQRACDNLLTKDVLVDTIKFLWIFVNINFNKIMPRTCILSDKYENFIINIIIALYKHQLDKPIVWLNAFRKYQEKYGGT